MAVQPAQGQWCVISNKKKVPVHFMLRQLFVRFEDSQ